MVYQIGDIVTGKVSGIQNYGIFVNLSDSEQGLMHISEIGNRYISNAFEEFSIGQEVRVLILNIDEYTGSISLSMRALNPDVELSDKPNKKKYWTNYRFTFGFTPIAKEIPRQIALAIANINKAIKN